MEKSGCFFSLLLLSLFLLAQFASCQRWDGVIVTQSDYKALRAIKNEFIDLKGHLRSWNDSGYGACSGGWVGIKCVQGQVIAIQLPWKGLGGRISENIGQLQALRKISLHDNVLAGTIPLSLGFLSDLRGVYLFNNRLSGSIPPSIVFALQHNNLSGSIPDSWGETGDNSYKLQFLTLDHNLITGNIPVSFSKLSLLQEISLSHNQISGSIPTELGKLSSLQKLDFSNNIINGSMPPSFSNLSSLVSLNLESNGLENQIPEAFEKLHNLSVLNLKNNQFKGLIPASIGNISSISQLDLAQNNFTGEIPASLAGLTNLASFNVSYNNLSGAVPALLSKNFNSSSFVGNLQLCGYSISTPCPSPPPVIQPSPTISGPPKHHHKKLSTRDIILIAVGALLGILLLLCCILICCLMRRRAASHQNGKTVARQAVEKTEKSGGAAAVESGGEMGGKLVHFDGPFVFTADDLLCATAEIMGKSTYGTAYKATLEDGNQVAVKRLREKTTKGQKEFESEAASLGKIRHPNLLALRAYYLGPKGEKLLVFDYMPKGSLASFLHARGPETAINWPTRMNIAIGIGRGLTYLHTEENIIHGNLTSSNILLDEQTNAHIADYGLSKLMTAAANTNIIATAGALGYRAPELAKLKNANTKTDVYSLGVIILELLTGKAPGEPTNGMDLPQWVASIVKEEWTNEVFDLELMRDAPAIGDELLNTLKLALHCVDPSPSARPEVQQVVQQLEEIKPDLAASSADEGTKPTSE
ncbi:probably inactive leucine-rich repeat receptor-like protein kinase IMK2 isoform X2 [Ricinus communis]|uniref:probably inactive leucine-rich repeat receptor-like protein kinase IMK2 isoform X2 n=1 Tax=Ricinus communis TaxID=3988 RepID=UPI00201A547C|nr:probably inactive leucine-rich repeat receptor-like protein kinase IMK2 isoform X2 [Ricinus communis]